MIPTSGPYIKLGDDEQRPQAADKAFYKKKVVLASGFGGVMSLVLMLAWSLRSEAPLTHKMVMTPKSSSVLRTWGENEKCYPFTGGTCIIYGCKEWRNAECTHPFGIEGMCTCPTGTCVGPVNVSFGYWDWGCYPKRNELVGDSVMFKNVEWKMFMYASDITGLWLEKGTKNAQFMVYKIPGPKLFGRLSMYTISPVTYPDYVLQMQTIQDSQTNSVHHKMFDSRPEALRTHITTAVDAAITMFVICRLQGNQIRFGVDYRSHTYLWAGTPHGSWEVFGTPEIGSYGKDDSYAGWTFYSSSMAAWETSEEFAQKLDQCPEH